MHKTLLRRGQAISALLIAVLIAMAFLTMLLAGVHAGHDHSHCTEDHCTVCVIIQVARALLRSLLLVSAMALLTLLTCLAGHRWHARLTHRRCPATLVALKTRLNP